MIARLQIHDYRGFSQFELSHIGRVNLLVGTNNCGKSSILEAIQMLAAVGDPSVLFRVATRRGERLFDEGDVRQSYAAEVDVSHFFRGHAIEPGMGFNIAAGPQLSLMVRVVNVTDRPLFATEESLISANGGEFDLNAFEWGLQLEWAGMDPMQLKLTGRGGLSSDSVRRPPRLRSNEPQQVRYISTAGLSVDDVVALFEQVVLTREEQLAIESLRTIQPSIERIATMSGDKRRAYPGDRGGIVVKCKGMSQRVPIGSMGDGMWRMLGIALALANAEGGILLIDEIDTGLHFSVMDRMWKLVDEASRRLSVQVFATTHSRDCYESLAVIARDTVSDGSEVTIQRIEPERKRSVSFTEQEIVAAAERGTEVR